MKRHENTPKTHKHHSHHITNHESYQPVFRTDLDQNRTHCLKFALFPCLDSVCCAQSCSGGSLPSDALHISVLVSVFRSPRHVMLCRSENTLQLFGKNRHMVIHCSFCWYFGASVSRVVFHQAFDADGTRTRLSKIRARRVMCQDVGVLHFSMYLMAFIRKTQELSLKISPRRPSSPQVVGVSLGESRGDVSLSRPDCGSLCGCLLCGLCRRDLSHSVDSRSNLLELCCMTSALYVIMLDTRVSESTVKKPTELPG